MSTSDVYYVDYCVIAAQTGAILRIGTCSLEALHLQPGSGELVTDAPPGISDDTHYWTGTGFAEYPPRPGGWCIWSGTAWIDPRSEREIENQEQQDLEDARARAVDLVNAYARQVRRSYVTDLPGQEALYLLKEQEARDWLGTANPQPEDFPLIVAEVGITGETPDQVAQVYLNLATLYLQAAAALEQLRLGTIGAIGNAASLAEIETALSAIPKNT